MDGDLLPLALSRHYSLSQIAAAWGMPYEAVVRIFRDEPGVIEIAIPGTKRKALRVPEDVLNRIYESGMRKEKISEGE